MKQYEQEAMNELIEEKKADIRAKTIQIQSVIERQHKELEHEEPLELDLAEVVMGHEAWLLKSLYDSREHTHDIVFEFPNLDTGAQVKCHSHILRSKSPYFDGLFKFSEVMDKRFVIEHYSISSFKAMIEYFYTGKCLIDSNDIVEMLEMCQEYMLPDLKQLIE